MKIFKEPFSTGKEQHITLESFVSLNFGKSILLFLFLMVMVGFSSCGTDDVDVASPTMEILDLDPDPVADFICGTQEDTVFNLKDGETLLFSVIFRDDVALSQYKVDIHNNFDCHGHGGASTPGISLPNVSNQTEDWSVLEIVDLDGQEQAVSRELDVPENVTAGFYHFQIQVIDESGNDNPLANFYSLKILNSKDEVPPTISVTEPAGSFEIAKGQEIHFEGEVSDNYSLSEGGNGILFLTYTDLSSGNTFTTSAVIAFDDSVDKEYQFSFDYEVPNTLVSGDFIFTLRLHDGYRNVAEPVNFDVTVTD